MYSWGVRLTWFDCNIRFEDALEAKRAFPIKCHYFYYFYLSKNENS